MFPGRAEGGGTSGAGLPLLGMVLLFLLLLLGGAAFFLLLSVVQCALRNEIQSIKLCVEKITLLRRGKSTTTTGGRERAATDKRSRRTRKTTPPKGGGGQATQESSNSPMEEEGNSNAQKEKGEGVKAPPSKRMRWESSASQKRESRAAPQTHKGRGGQSSTKPQKEGKRSSYTEKPAERKRPHTKGREAAPANGAAFLPSFGWCCRVTPPFGLCCFLSLLLWPSVGVLPFPLLLGGAVVFPPSFG